jgi:hypothetical protein
MATFHFDWNALKLYNPHEQYDLMLQTVSMLSDEAKTDFMTTDQFFDWVNSKEMSAFFDERKRAQQDEDD